MVGVAGSQLMSNAVRNRSPNKLWRSKSTFNLWVAACSVPLRGNQRPCAEAARSAAGISTLPSDLSLPARSASNTSMLIRKDHHRKNVCQEKGNFLKGQCHEINNF
jgi:hypothetical protein